MGQYLSCGIATRITIMKEDYERQEILEEMGKEIDLNIYNVLENEREVILEIKKNIFEKYVSSFILEQLNLVKEDYITEREIKEIVELEGKSYEELIEYSKAKICYNFQFLEGCRVCNDISYLSPMGHLRIYADIISYIDDGKVFFECYYEIFKYLRKAIIKSSTNPIKTACVITIIG